MPSPPALLLTNIRQLLTLRGPATPRRGRQLLELGIIEDAAVLCVAGKIVSLGTRAEARRDGWLQAQARKVRDIDCRGGVLVPGFVDSHTHPAFVTPRLADFEKRASGYSYEEIARAGGGIRSSVDGVRRASRSTLSDLILSRLEDIAAHGTTTVEAKSGYGLNLDSEIKSLDAIRDATRRWPGTVAATLLGAHTVPREHQNNPERYVNLVCQEMIPAAAWRKLAQFVDVFIERGTFTLTQAKRIAAEAFRHGLGFRAHVSQLSRTPLSSLLALQPSSLDHLDHLTAADIQVLARSNTVATLLPGANYFLGTERYPPARKLIDASAAVALATDYNPGTSPTVSMPMVLSLACTQMALAPAEAISTATINAAHSLRLAARKGSIEPGKDADFALFAASDYREIPYWFGVNRCAGVCLNGYWIWVPRAGSAG